MTDARQPRTAGGTIPPDDLERPEADPVDRIEVEADLEVMGVGAAGADPEVSPADAWEQSLPADPSAPPGPRLRLAATDAEVSPADAWEQSIPVDLDEDY